MTALKYAVVERERRWLLGGVPDLPDDAELLSITDRYLDGTRLRLREMTGRDGAVVRKLGHKVRLSDGAAEVACTSLYLDDVEWDVLAALPGRVLWKQRWRLLLGERRVAVDVFAGELSGLVLAELDRGDGPDLGLPDGFDPVAEVTADEAFTGGALAACSRDALVAAAARHGLDLS